MTKEITKSIILQKLQDKFKLREFLPTKFLFDETVVPVYSIESELEEYEVLSKTMSITSAAGFSFFVVPDNQRWTLRAYQVIFGGTGAHKGTGLYIAHRPAVGNIIYLDMTKGQEISYLVNLPVPVVLENRNDLRYLIDTYVSTQSLTIDIDVKVEDVR